jgi:hypothetical protein
MSLSTNKASYAIMESSFMNDSIQDTHKKNEQEQAQLLQLTALLTKIQAMLATGGSDDSTGVKGCNSSNNLCSSPGLGAPSPSFGDSSPIPQDAPSSNEITSMLAAMAQMVAELQKTKGQSADNASAQATEIMINQIQQSMKMLQALEAAEQQVNEEWKEYQNFINNPNNQQAWQNDMAQEYWGWKFWDWGNSDPDSSDVCNSIINWVKQTFGITITLNADTYGKNDLNALIQDASDQVSAALNAKLTAPLNALEAFCYSTNNPALMSLFQMIQHNEKISGSQLETLEKIMTNAIKAMVMLKNASGDMSDGGPSNALMAEMAALMTSSVNNLQGVIAQMSADKAGSDQKVSQAFAENAQKALESVERQIAIIAEKKAEENAFDKFIMAITIIVTIVVTAVAIASGQYWMAGIAIATCAMQLSGGFNKLADDVIAPLLEACGVSKDKADMIAEWIVVAITIIVTVLVGNYASTANTLEQGGAEALETGAEQAGRASEVIANGAEEASQASKSAFSKALETLGKLNPFRYLSTTTNMAIEAGTQSLMGSNAIQDTISYAMKAEGKSDAQIQKAEEIAGIITAVVGALVSIGSAEAVSNSLSETMSAAKSTSRLTKILDAISEKIKSMVSLSTLFSAQRWTQLVSQVSQSGAGIALGVIQKQQADCELKIGEAEALEQLMNSFLQITDNGMKNSMSNYQKMIKNNGQISNEVNQEMLAGEAMYAQLLSNAV